MILSDEFIKTNLRLYLTLTKNICGERTHLLQFLDLLTTAETFFFQCGEKI